MELYNKNNLKGIDAVNRSRDLMNIFEGETKKTTKRGFEYVKRGSNNTAFAIVKENSKYFLKKANIHEGLHYTEFDYINGERGKTNYMFTSYDSAMNSLNNVLVALNESHGSHTHELGELEVNYDDIVNKVAEKVIDALVGALDVEDTELGFEVEDDIEYQEEDEDDIFGDNNYEVDSVEDMENGVYESLNQIENILSEGLKKKI